MTYKVLLVGLLISVSSLAGQKIVYDQNALSLLTSALTFCPNELQEIWKGANSVSAATLEANDAWDHHVYTIRTSGGGYAPSFRRYSVGTLTITRTVSPNQIGAPDAPTVWETKCAVVRH